MRKIISLFLSLCIALNLCLINVFAQENHYQKSWDLFEGLGILPFMENEKNSEITRAEFASVISSVLGLNQEGLSSSQYENSTPSFGNPNDETSFKDSSNDYIDHTQIFNDVNSEHVLCNDINAVTKLGIMSGFGDGSFRPDDVLKYEEAVKTFVLLCGYNTVALVKGGWLEGYLDTAREIEILLSNKSVGQTLTKEELVEMFSKVLEVGVNDLYSSFGTVIYFNPENGQSFLNQYMNIGVVEGQVTEVENTTLTSPIPTDKTIKIAEKTLYNDNNLRTNQYLGRYVEAYYDLDDLTLLYINYSKRDRTIVIPAEDIIGFEDGVILYEYGKSVRRYSVGAKPVIYNGTAKTSYDETIFDFQFGDITITDNGVNDVVIVRDFSDMIIGGIFNDPKKIYSENGEVVLEFNDDKLYFIYDETKKEIDFSELMEGDIISYIASENYVEIYKSSQKTSGNLERVDTSDYEIIVDGNRYTVDRNALTANLGKHIGEQVTIYINIFGGVFEIITSGVYDNIAILLSSGSEHDDYYNGWVKLFMKNGKIKVYPLSEKIRYYPQTQVEANRINGNTISSVLGEYTGLVNFKLNSKGEIKELMIPLKDKNLKRDGDGRLWEKSVVTQKGSNNLYDTNSTSIGRQVYFDASSRIFSVPVDGEIDDYKALSTNDFTNIGKMAFSGVKAYYAELSDTIAVATVINDFSRPNYTPDAYLSVVTSIEEELNEYDEIRKTITVTNSNNVTAELFSDSNHVDRAGNSCTAFDIAITDFASGEREIDVGDIIGYKCVPGSTKEVSEVVLFFDADMQNVPGGKKGYLAMATPGSDLYYIKKSSLNIVDEWNRNSSGYLNTSQILSGYSSLNSIGTQNPIRFEDGANEVFKTNTHRDYGGGRRYMLGYVSQKTDAFFHLTTQDLSIPGAVWVKDGIPATQKPCPHANPDDYTGIYYQEWQRYVTYSGSILNVDYYNRGIEVRPGTPADIYSYENSKNDASRVLSDTLYNRHIIINDYRSY